MPLWPCISIYMISLAYDLHIHSCLSPCADDDMTPGNIVAMSALKELDVIALTDHNSCKNCPAFMEIAKGYNLTAIPGMELCTSEEVHVLCLFKSLEDALSFDQYVYDRLPAIPNNENIFGKQQICSNDDEVTGTEPNLLINAAAVSFTEVGRLMEEFNGIMIPAHIDKNSNSLLSNLGFIPPDSDFTCVELRSMENLHRLRHANPYLEKCRIITDSDAHSLGDINEADNFIYAEGRSIAEVIASLRGLF